MTTPTATGSNGGSSHKTKPKGRRFLVGSVVTAEQPTKAAQTPPIPTQQLVPVHSEKVKARDALGLQTKREKKVKRALDRVKNHTATRQRFGLSRRDVAKLLDRQDVTSRCEAYLVGNYVRLAEGNISEADLAKHMNVTVLGLNVLLATFEKEVITMSLHAGVRLKHAKPMPYDPEADFDKTKEQDDRLVDRALERGLSGDTDSIIADFGDEDKDRNAKNIRMKYPKKTESFDDHDWGQRSKGSTNDHDLTGAARPDHDDYGEESDA